MEDLETLLLGAPRTLTSPQVVERAGLSEELAEAVWAALGFAEVGDDEVAFTELDAEALKTSGELLATGVVDVDSWLVMARTTGQAMARLAEAQIDVFRRVAGELSAEDFEGFAVATSQDVLPRIEALLMFTWRRQFAAAVQRALASAPSDHGLPTLAVGFVDIVDYTRSSRSWDAAQLERTLETFERDVALRLAAVGGRVVKTLGDGVLFTTDTAAAAVEVALETVAAHLEDEELPAVRAGVALGPVLVRLGDVYGEPVNLASRLSDEARPSSVLVDRQAAAALAEVEGLEVRPLGKRSVRGFRSVTPFLVRWEP
jgi:adenylate cyclase